MMVVTLFLTYNLFYFLYIEQTWQNSCCFLNLLRAMRFFGHIVIILVARLLHLLVDLYDCLFIIFHTYNLYYISCNHS